VKGEALSLGKPTFGTVLITKDRNWCLERTVRALHGTELAARPLVVINNGATHEDPLDVLHGLDFEYIELPENTGIVGGRLYAHRTAAAAGWDYYCFLQDDFELRAKTPWLCETLEFMERFHVDYCRLTMRETALNENEHWVKGTLRVKSGARFWNCSHIQQPKGERVGERDFLLTDKHYSDWVHVMSRHGSHTLFDVTAEQLSGPTVTDLLLSCGGTEALRGALRNEFDIAVKHWLAYALGKMSATGLLVDRSCWCGAFDHFTGMSTSEYCDLPHNPERALLIEPRRRARVECSSQRRLES